MNKMEFLEYIKDEEESGLELTDNPMEAIYAIGDILVDGCFDMGMRGADHNTLLADGVGWDELLHYGTIIVPETGTMIGDKHKHLPYEILPMDSNHITGYKDGGR